MSKKKSKDAVVELRFYDGLTTKIEVAKNNQKHLIEESIKLEIPVRTLLLIIYVMSLVNNNAVIPDKHIEIVKVIGGTNKFRELLINGVTGIDNKYKIGEHRFIVESVMDEINKN